MRYGSGVSLVFLYVVATLHGCGAISACPPKTATVGTSRDRTSGREKTGRTSTCRSRRQDYGAGPSVPVRNESDWPSGTHSRPRKAREVGWQRKGGAKPELLDEGLRWSHRSAVVGRHDESGDRRDVSGQRQHVARSTSPECAAVLHPDHAAHWSSTASRRQGATWLRAWKRGVCWS